MPTFVKASMMSLQYIYILTAIEEEDYKTVQDSIALIILIT
jgi:hypothetical protein